MMLTIERQVLEIQLGYFVTIFTGPIFLDIYLRNQGSHSLLKGRVSCHGNGNFRIRNSLLSFF